MCGIIGFKVGNNLRVNKLRKRIRNIYENQKSRGTQGGGVYIQRSSDDEIIYNYYRSENPEDALQVLFKDLNDGLLKKDDLVLFHHRIPTCTSNKAEFNHPLRTGSVTVVHNGWISNATELSKNYVQEITTWEKEKYKNSNYDTFTDSELISIILNEELARDEYKVTPESIRNAIEVLCTKIKGNLAIAFTVDGDDRIWLFKTTHPIVTYDDKHGNHYFSSESPEKNDDGKPYGSFINKYVLEAGEYGCIGITGYNRLGLIDKTFVAKTNTYTSRYYDDLNGYNFNKNSVQQHFGNPTVYDEEDLEEPNEYVDIRSKKKYVDTEGRKGIADMFRSIPIFDKLIFTPYDDLMKFKKECEMDNWSTLFKNETERLQKETDLKKFVVQGIKDGDHPTKNTCMGEIVQGILDMRKRNVISEEAVPEILRLIRPSMQKAFDDFTYENMFLFRLSNLLKLKLLSFEMALKNFIDQYGAEGIDDFYMFYELMQDYENYYTTERREFVAGAKRIEKEYYGFCMEEYKDKLTKRITEYNKMKLVNLTKEINVVKTEVIDMDSEREAISKLFTGCPTSEYNEMLEKNPNY
jgi:hypothetical protein